MYSPYDHLVVVLVWVRTLLLLKIAGASSSIDIASPCENHSLSPRSLTSDLKKVDS